MRHLYTRLGLANVWMAQTESDLQRLRALQMRWNRSRTGRSSYLLVSGLVRSARWFEPRAIWTRAALRPP